ncbi:succinate dehydrogenase hydrophobic membrane anchor subunit [mine drainage metagenome]|uniref:Succinate dehydrogenase hydrophobic membrane anchor subunit n=1 Tax=mine drainage metagenome TaxID=410659 RepID=A0A1J5R8C8_9ZZZZ
MRLLGGLRPWVIQRLSALFMLGCFAVLAACLAIGPPLSFAAWRAWMSEPVAKVAAFLLFSSLFLHAWIGLRDVLLDYVQPLALRALLFVAIALGLISLEGWVVVILAGVH